MADITRDSFDESKKVIKKILQQGRFLLDSDFNELADVLVTQRRRVLASLVGNDSRRFGDGFKVVGTGASLQVTIKAGFAAFFLGTDLAELLQLKEDTTLSGFATWGSSRTDHIYIDIEEKEFSAADDADIVNPAIGEETCRDVRLVQTIKISQGAAPGSPPAGHTYVTLATVTKTSGSTISAGDVTVVLEEYSFDVETEDIVDDAVTKEKLNADCAGTALAQDTDGSLKVADSGIATTQLADGAVTEPKIGSGAVTSAKIGAGAVIAGKLGTGAVGTADMADDAVTKEKLAADCAGGGMIQAADGSLEARVRFIPHELGWNMDTVDSKHFGLSDLAGEVFFASCAVKRASDGQIFPLHYRSTDGTAAGYFNYLVIGTQITLDVYRVVGGFFDDSSFSTATLLTTIAYLNT